MTLTAKYNPLESVRGQRSGDESIPVIISADQTPIPVILEIGPPIDIGTVDQGDPNTNANAWPVKITDGTNLLSITAAGEAKVDITQPLPAGTNVIGHVVTDAGSVTAASQSGAWTTGRTWNLLSTTDSVNAVQSGAWAVTATQGTSPWVVSGTVAATQSGSWTTGRTWTLASGTDSVASVQSGSWNILNITGAISLPTGAATSALQTTGNTSLSSIDGKLNSLGQKTMAGSVPVVIASDQTAVPVTVSGLPATTDTNYGTVGANTLRTAAQIGNATGAALFGAGTTTAQVLRVVLPTDQTAIPATQSGTWSVLTPSFPTAVDTNYGAVGASTLRSAAQIGNATGAALFGAGTTTTQVLRVVLPTDQTAIPATQSGSWTVAATQSGTWSVLTPSFPTTVDTNYGTVGASTLRSAAQIGNATGAALFGAGTTTAQVLRVVLPTDQTSIPVAATLSAETTKVIGVVRNADGSGNLLTSTGNALDVNIKTSSITITADTSLKPQSGSTYATSRSSSSAYETNRAAKASPGNLYRLTGFNSKATSQFIQVHNSTSLPGNGTVPIYTFFVPGTSNFSLDFGAIPTAFSTGITIANSSTGPTLTVGAADCFFTVDFS